MTTTRQRKTRKTTGERQAMVAALRERLEKWLPDIPPADLARLTAKLDGYSDRNASLIAMQCWERGWAATDVDGFRAWLDRGRCVRKGERGLQILAPMTGTDEPAEGSDGESRTWLRFRIAYVFDISQTDPAAGEDTP